MRWMSCTRSGTAAAQKSFPLPNRSCGSCTSSQHPTWTAIYSAFFMTSRRNKFIGIRFCNTNETEFDIQNGINIIPPFLGLLAQGGGDVQGVHSSLLSGPV